MVSAVKLEHVSVKLGGHLRALRDVSATIAAGRIIGFIGPSGAGKTTLIRSIVGRQRLSGGSITVLGQRAGTEALRHEVSYMTQAAAAYADLSVADNVRYFATMAGVPRGEVATMVGDILATVDLTPQADQLVGKLSGGQRQRVSLALALVGNPKLMVLDEPTVGLDPVLREQLWQLFRQQAAAGRTVIISSHVMDEASRCDELLLIRDGELLAQGSPAELCEQTDTHDVETAFLKLVEAKA